MNVFQVKYIVTVITFFCGWVVFGQKGKETTKDTLRTESVTVIKTFNPTINDAFKIETPVSEEKDKKEPQKVSPFKIQSVPVASTFVPKKAKSIKVKKERIKLPPQNYASLGGGNFGNAEAEVFVSSDAGREGKFSALLEHQSSQGGIDNIRVDDFYYDTELLFSYENQNRNTPWGLSFGAQHQLYNWYGIPQDLVLTEAELVNLDPSHNFVDLNVGGTVAFNNSIVKGLDTQLRYFFDNYNSSEVHFIAKPHFNVELQDKTLDLPMELDVLSGSFKPDSFFSKRNYQLINVGVKPSVSLNYYGMDLKLGVTGYVNVDTENSETNFYVYPNILASYQFTDYGVSVFGGLTGGLQQNTYRKASAENPFIAPLLDIVPTSEQFNLFAGVQGSLTSELSFEVKASYKTENDKALFQKLGAINTPINRTLFGFNNAFGYVYGDINTGSLSGNLNYSVADNYSISLNANFYTYDTKRQSEAWNLPQITTTLTGNYKIDKKWRVDTSIFFIGTRKDFDSLNNQVVDVDPIFDLNLGVNYSIDENWKLFLRGKNITNQNYERWLGYPVQSAQALAGIRYLF